MTTKKTIYSALSDFQQKVKIVPFDSNGYNYKYASLTAVWNAVQAPLMECGLVVTQVLKEPPAGFDVCVHTILTHPETGDQVESVLPMTSPKKDPQGFGSLITYARRYALVALLGLVADEDTDASDNKEPELKEINGEMFQYTDQGWQRTPEAQKEYAQATSEFKKLRASIGLSIKDVEQLFGVKVTTGLSIGEVSNLIDKLLDYQQRREQNQLTDEEQALLTA